MLRKVAFVLLVGAMAVVSLDLKVEYWAEVNGHDMSLVGDAGSVRDVTDTRTITHLRDGQKLIVDFPCVVWYWVEIEYLRVPIQPKPHVKIDLRNLTALKPEKIIVLAAISGLRSRRIMLNWPPASSPWHLPTAVPWLTSYLREQGHEVVQSYGHIEALDYVLRKYGGSGVDWALGVVRGHSDVLALHQARMVLESASRQVPADGRFEVLRNNINYISEYRDGTIEGVLRAIKEREQNAWYDYFVQVEVPRAVNFNPEVYGISVADDRQLIPACVLASMVKEALPGTMVVLGGNIWSQVMTAYERPEFAGFSRFCDAVVYREGFIPMRELAATLDPAKASGTVWFDQNKVVVNPPTETPIDFNSLPTPVFELEPSQWLPEPVYPMYTMSNCPYACGFCAICVGSDTCGQPPRRMSPERVAEYMMRTGGRHFDVADESFLIDRQLAIGRALTKQGYSAVWRCFLNADERLLDPNLCRQLYEAGCRLTEMGLESLSSDTLHGEGKGRNKPEHYGQIVANLRQAGIMTHVFGMVGVPGEPMRIGLKWLAFLTEHGRDILTVKVGRYRLARMSPDGLMRRHAGLIEILKDDKPFHANLDFTYKGTPSRKQVEAALELIEECSRRHWAYEATSTVNWGRRLLYDWSKFEQMAAALVDLTEHEPTDHLARSVNKVEAAVGQELGEKVHFSGYDDVVEFSRRA